MKPSSVILIGNGTAAVRAFQALQRQQIAVPIVLADPSDTGKDSWRLSLVKAAIESGFEMGRDLFLPENPNHAEILARIESAQADLILSVQCARILRRSMLSSSRCGIINMHNAPLPLLRGCDPFSWAIHDGLETMGVTLHRILDEGVDNGPILAQRFWPIEEDTTAWDLYTRALDEAETLIAESVEGIINGQIEAIEQSVCCVTYHPMGQFDFRAMQIQWDNHAATLSAWIRSRIFPPFQLPHFEFEGRRVYVLGCCRRMGRGTPGTVLGTSPLRVATRSGCLEVSEIRTDSESLSGGEFAQEVGLREGMVLPDIRRNS